MSEATTGTVKEEPKEVSESNTRKVLYDKMADLKTQDDLAKFMKEAMEMPHGYGSVCVAIAACAVAAARVADRGPNGGITGFQAGAIMWEFMRGWNGVEAPCSLIKYKDMLYPQYQDKFAQTIHPKTWEWLKEEAKKTLDEHKKSGNSMSPNVTEHMQSVVNGMVPFGFTVAEDS